MANVVLKTYAAGDNNQGSVTPQNDALIYQTAVPMNGLFYGGTITLSSANVLHVAAGMGIIGGRFFEVLESDIPVQLSASGDLFGRLYIHLDLSNADNPIEINAVTGASLPALQGDPDLNISIGVFDMELCTFDINELTISNIVQTFPTITAANNQIRRATAYNVNDLVFCQSASNSLIFVCTTAGTTAVQQPMGYATITDGNTITDGTAVFKAVGLMAEITRNQQLIAPVLTSLVAPTGGLSTGQQFIYNGLLYKATAAIAQGETIVIDGNAELADSVTEQLESLSTDVTRRIKRFVRAISGVTSSKKLKITRNSSTDVYFVILRGTNGGSHYSALISGYGGGSNRNSVIELAKGTYITSAEFKTSDSTDRTFEFSFSGNISEGITIVICSLYSDASEYTVTLV